MRIIFTTIAIPPYWVKETILLVESLRKFGGQIASQPVVVLTRQGSVLPPAAKSKLEALDATLAEFKIEEDARKFPLAVVPYGAAAAEVHVGGSSDLMVWLLPDTLVLNPPLDFALPGEVQLGYRPVHHQNIGSSYGQPIDDFWQQIYAHCQVREERIFQMDTCYRESVRPYFNAGLLVTRPGEGLMQNWLEMFQRTYRHPDFTPFYADRKYAVFMHQAVLSGIILYKYTQDQLYELPESYNYPLHMHTHYPEEYRIHQLAELVTARYENTKELPKYLMDFNDERTDWLDHKLDATAN